MKRLSVRLSVVAVVLAIGSYAVFQTVVWRNKNASAQEPGTHVNAKPTGPDRARPIPDESGSDDGSKLVPPPSEAFAPGRFPVVKASQHEPADEENRENASEPRHVGTPPSPTFGQFQADSPATTGAGAAGVPPQPAFGVGQGDPTPRPLGSSPYSLRDHEGSGEGSSGEAPGTVVQPAPLDAGGSPVVTAESLRRAFADIRSDTAVQGAPTESADPFPADRDQHGDGAAPGRFAPVGQSGSSSFPVGSTLQQPVSRFADVQGGAAAGDAARPAGAGAVPGYADRAPGFPAVGARPQSDPSHLPTRPGPAAQNNPYVGADRYGSGSATPPAGGPLAGVPPMAGQVAFASVSTPGPRTLEGQQAPTLAVEKTAPSEVQVGRQATFDIRVRNTGAVTAHQVIVVDQVPEGTVLVGATPPPAQGADGSLVWQLGTLEPNDEAIISLDLLPQQEGEIGSVAQVLFHTQASVRTICTRPQLKIEQNAQRRVLIGQSLVVDIVMSNSGSGAAEAVVMESDIPDGLSHPAGSQLEKNVGQLRPGETKRFDLQLRADKPGFAIHRLVVRNEDKVVDTHEIEIEIVAPQLEVGLAGPTRRYLQRKATYQVGVANPGTAPAQNIELIAYLPKGLKFVATGNEGAYDPQNHAVFWNLVELPAGSVGDVQLTVLPIEAGAQKIRIEGRGDLGIEHSYEHNVGVESVAELAFTIADSADPIEVGSETVYVVEIVNNGTKPDTNIRLGAELPPGLRPLRGDGPTAAYVQGQAIVFDPLGRLDPGQSASFKIAATGTAKGDHVIRVGIVSDEIPVAVSKEERTHVYADH